MKASLLAAMIEEGYPEETAGQVADILGIRATFDRFMFIIRARNVYDTEPARA